MASDKPIDVKSVGSSELRSDDELSSKEMPPVVVPELVAPVVLPRSNDQIEPQSAAGVIGSPSLIRSHWTAGSKDPPDRPSSTTTSETDDGRGLTRRWKVIAVLSIVAVFLAFLVAAKEFILVKVGTAAVNSGMTGLAISIYDVGLSSDPKNLQVLSAWGNMRLAKDPASSLDLYTDLVRHSPDNASSYLSRANALALLNRDAEALEQSNKALFLDQNDVTAYSFRGDLYKARALYRLAIADYSKAIDLLHGTKLPMNEPSRVTESNLGNNILIHSWVGDEFVNDLSTPGQAYFLESRIYDNRGYCFQRLNRFREAVQDYSIALRLNPNNRKGLQRRSTCYKQLGDPRWQDDFRKAQTLPEN